MIILAASLSVVVAYAMCNFVYAWCASTVWSMLLSAQFGPSPTFKMWFGFVAIAILFKLAISITPKMTDKPKIGWEVVRELWGKAIAKCVVAMTIVGITWCIAAIAGWL